jgi:hypothetical protein
MGDGILARDLSDVVEQRTNLPFCTRERRYAGEAADRLVGS